jgi:hypothetical protein
MNYTNSKFKIDLENQHNNIYERLNIDYNFIFGEIEIDSLSKNDINYFLCIYYFWKDRYNDENISIDQNIINNYSIQNIKKICYKIKSLGITDIFKKIMNDTYDPLNTFYQKFNTTRYEHIMKMSKALNLYSLAKNTSETFKVCNTKTLTLLKEYKITESLMPEPCLYLSKQQIFFKLFVDLLKIKEDIINLIRFHRKSKAILNYYNFMYFNFDKNYGKEFQKFINNSNDTYYKINKFKRLRIKK